MYVSHTIWQHQIIIIHIYIYIVMYIYRCIYVYINIYEHLHVTHYHLQSQVLIFRTFRTKHDYNTARLSPSFLDYNLPSLTRILNIQIIYIKTKCRQEKKWKRQKNKSIYKARIQNPWNPRLANIGEILCKAYKLRLVQLFYYNKYQKKNIYNRRIRLRMRRNQVKTGKVFTKIWNPKPKVKRKLFTGFSDKL